MLDVVCDLPTDVSRLSRPLQAADKRKMFLSMLILERFVASDSGSLWVRWFHYVHLQYCHKNRGHADSLI